jgi:hypothetical protein
MNRQKVIAAYTRPAPVVWARKRGDKKKDHIADARQMVERPSGWHRFANRVLAAR